GEPTLFTGHEGAIKGATLSKDGVWAVTIATDGTMRIWRTDGQGEAFVLQAPSLISVAFGPDGLLTTIDTTGRVRAWPLCTIAECVEFLWGSTALCLSPDERAARLGEQPEDAERRAAECHEEVAGRMAAGAYR